MPHLNDKPKEDLASKKALKKRDAFKRRVLAEQTAAFFDPLEEQRAGYWRERCQLLTRMLFSVSQEFKRYKYEVSVEKSKEARTTALLEEVARFLEKEKMVL